MTSLSSSGQRLVHRRINVDRLPPDLDTLLSGRLLLCSTLLFTRLLMAQHLPQGLPAPQTESSVQATVPALLLSDIHFEPFADPGKVPALVAAPTGKWPAILAGPPSADQEQRFAALQSTCHARGEDTSYTLLQSSLHAMQAHAAGAAFVTLSGDLIAHAFSCKYNSLIPHPKPREYEAFVAKTLEFVMASLRTAFPNIPIYAALGNNDTACGDYQLDARVRSSPLSVQPFCRTCLPRNRRPLSRPLLWAATTAPCCPRLWGRPGSSSSTISTWLINTLPVAERPIQQKLTSSSAGRGGNSPSRGKTTKGCGSWATYRPELMPTPPQPR